MIAWPPYDDMTRPPLTPMRAAPKVGQRSVAIGWRTEPGETVVVKPLRRTIAMSVMLVAMPSIEVNESRCIGRKTTGVRMKREKLGQ
jgi:hypothetical protein